MNDIVAKQNSLPAELAGLVEGLRETKRDFAEGSGSVALLKLAKSGEWLVGKEEDGVDIGTEAVVNVPGIERGYVCWGTGPDEGKLLGSVRTPLAQPAPNPRDLPALNGAWEKVVAIPMTLLLEGGSRLYPVLHTAQSKGAKEAADNLLTAVLDQASAGRPYIPVVALHVDSYKHDKYGRIYKPVFRVVRWLTVEQAAAGADTPAPELSPPAAAPSGGRRRRL